MVDVFPAYSLVAVVVALLLLVVGVVAVVVVPEAGGDAVSHGVSVPFRDIPCRTDS